MFSVPLVWKFFYLSNITCKIQYCHYSLTKILCVYKLLVYCVAYSDINNEPIGNFILRTKRFSYQQKKLILLRYVLNELIKWCYFIYQACCTLYLNSSCSKLNILIPNIVKTASNVVNATYVDRHK